MKRRWKLESAVLVILVSAFGYFLGCEPNPDALVSNGAPAAGTGNSRQPTGTAPVNGQYVSTRPASSRTQKLPVRTGQTILIATFNIQVLGRSKMSKPGMAERLAEIIRQFDVVAIQEIRDESQDTVPRLLQYVNANGSRYDYIISKPLGRTTSKEQYAYLFDTSTIVGSIDASYTVNDAEDWLHREPLVARFITRLPPTVRPFSFTLVNLHTDPDEVSQEIPVMDRVLKSIREFEYQYGNFEDDVLLMGDLNVEPRQFGPLGQIPGITWVIDKEPTNTIRTKTYDNILFDRELTNEFTGRAGVLDLGDMFQLRTEDVKLISDHLPVWAEFQVVEQPTGGASGRVANANGTQRR